MRAARSSSLTPLVAASCCGCVGVWVCGCVGLGGWGVGVRVGVIWGWLLNGLVWLDCGLVGVGFGLVQLWFGGVWGLGWLNMVWFGRVKLSGWD